MGSTKQEFGLRPSIKKAVIELIFAGSLWGFGFVATKWALISFTTFELLSYRFLIAFLAGEIVLYFMDRAAYNFHLQEFKITWPAGILMSIFMVMQTFGLESTTATKSAFLTTLYTLLMHFLFKQKTKAKMFFSALLAVLGSAFLMEIHKESQMNRGDILTLFCMIVAAFHIIYIGFSTRKMDNSFRYNNLQSFWSFLFIAPFILTQDQVTVTAPSLPWFGVLFMALGSSLVAFTIQLRSQKVLSNTAASMLFLLESPFGFLFGFIFLGETLNPLQLVGAGLILLGSYLAIKFEAGEGSPVKTHQ